MGAALGAILVSMPLAASAEELTVWSGYPEMVPFYKHVAESMKADYPDLTVNVQAIPLREHEKRVALGLTSGIAGDVIELAVSTATRYLQNDLLEKAPDDIVAYVERCRPTSTSSSPMPASSTAPSMACRCSAARARSSTTPTCSRRPA